MARYSLNRVIRQFRNNEEVWEIISIHYLAKSHIRSRKNMAGSYSYLLIIKLTRDPKKF